MIQLPRVFQDKMVFQREKPIRLWGTADRDETVTVYADGELVLTQTVAPGDFRLTLPARSVTENLQLRICAGEQVIELNDVAVGEVWIAGGQSNMEFLLKHDKTYRAEHKAITNDRIRYYEVGKYCFPGEREEGLTVREHWDRWLPLNEENAPNYSAVAYYFVTELSEKLDCPIGVIGCSKGGTSASTWLDAKELEGVPELRSYLDRYNKAISGLDMEKYLADDRKNRERNEGMKDRIDNMNAQTPAALSLMMHLFMQGRDLEAFGPHSPNAPGNLYKTMLSEIKAYPCRGVIWYQGESDDLFPSSYAKLFEQLVNCWRRDWGEELSFYTVQLSPFGWWMTSTGKPYPTLRAQQEKASRELPKVHMISIMDAGMKKDIHPKDKKPVGHRLALQALHYEYGYELLCEPPYAESAKRDGEKLILHFCEAGEGLTLSGNRVEALTLMVDGRKCSFRVTVEGDRMILQTKALTNCRVAEVSFAEVDYCRVNLFNSAGLPAKPFHIRYSR